jgi:hypothetical protein
MNNPDICSIRHIGRRQTKQQSSTLHIGTHILSKSSKDNTQNPNQTHYQLTSHLQSNTLIVRFNHSADSPALVIIDRVLCGVAFVCFGELVKGVIVMPI